MFTADELLLIRTALRTRIARDREALERGESLGLSIDPMEKLFRKVTDLFEVADAQDAS